MAHYSDLETTTPYDNPFAGVKTVTLESKMNDDVPRQLPPLDTGFQEGGKNFETNPFNGGSAPF